MSNLISIEKSGENEDSSSKYAAAGFSKGPILKTVAGCTIASASSARSDFAWALGIYCHVYLILIYCLLMSPAALFCVCFSAHSACMNQSSRLLVFLEILLRHEPAEGVCCGFLLGFF